MPMFDRFLICFLSTDNGGGMTPDKMRQCMSLGYSAKSKLANTIGQCELSYYFSCKDYSISTQCFFQSYYSIKY